MVCQLLLALCIGTCSTYFISLQILMSVNSMTSVIKVVLISMVHMNALVRKVTTGLEVLVLVALVSMCTCG